MYSNLSLKQWLTVNYFVFLLQIIVGGDFNDHPQKYQVTEQSTYGIFRWDAQMNDAEEDIFHNLAKGKAVFTPENPDTDLIRDHATFGNALNSYTSITSELHEAKYSAEIIDYIFHKGSQVGHNGPTVTRTMHCEIPEETFKTFVEEYGQLMSLSDHSPLLATIEVEKQLKLGDLM